MQKGDILSNVFRYNNALIQIFKDQLKKRYTI